jgi:hypothetical protein
MNKESFLIYKSFYEPLKGLSDEDMGKIFRAIFEYQISGKLPEINPILNMAFSFIKDVLDRDNLKYLEIVKRNQNNGKSGGRPNKKPKKPSGLFGNPKNPKNPSEPDNDNVNDNVNDNEYENINIFNFKKSLIELGISKKTVEDWLKVRKTKKATNTETAFYNIKSELLKSILTPEESIKIACEKSWSGFKAEWILNLQPKNRTRGSNGVLGG